MTKSSSVTTLAITGALLAAKYLPFVPSVNGAQEAKIKSVKFSDAREAEVFLELNEGLTAPLTIVAAKDSFAAGDVLIFADAAGTPATIKVYPAPVKEETSSTARSCAFMNSDA